MRKDVGVPGVLLPGITLPPNWEAAYGYPWEQRRAEGFRYLAVWWEMGGGEAAYSDGCTCASARWQVFEDLVSLMKQAGFGGVRGGLGSFHLDATHVLLLDLEGRGVRMAPLPAALAWLEQVAPPLPVVDLPGVDTVEGMDALLGAIQQGIDEFREVKRWEWKGRRLCPVCRGVRWRRAGNWPADGYVACTVCEHGLVADEGSGVVADGRQEGACGEEITERGGTG